MLLTNEEKESKVVKYTHSEMRRAKEKKSENRQSAHAYIENLSPITENMYSLSNIRS